MRKRFAVTSLMLAALLVACGGLFATSTPIPTPTPTPTPTPKELLEQAVGATLDAESLTFTLVREGEAVLFDQTTGIKFSEASGEYQAPDRVHATIKAQFGGSVIELEIFWLPEGVYVSNPLTGGFTKTEVPLAFDGAAAFSETGFAAVLKMLDNVTREGAETIEGVETLHLRGAIDRSEVDVSSPIRALFAVEGAYTVDVWVDMTTSHIVRTTLTEPDGSKWTIDFSGFDEPVEIKPPEGVLP